MPPDRNAMILIAGGFVRYFMNDSQLSHRYLRAGIASTLLAYLTTFWWWAYFIEASPTAKFGQVWCDWFFHINGSFWLLLAAIYIFTQSLQKTRNTVTLALLLFTVSDFLKLPDMALHEVYEYVFTSIARVSYLLAIFILGYVYLQEYSLERKQAESLSTRYQVVVFYKTMWQHLIETRMWEGEIWDRRKI